MSQTDAELLAQYSKNYSDEPFAELVRRHLGLVYHSSLRQVRSSQLAEEVSQTVFLKLAKKSSELSRDTVVTSWLYHVTRQESIDVLRRETRRQERDQLAYEMIAKTSSDADWTNISPILDDAMAELDEKDRLALLLRYFENKSLRDVGATLGISDDTAQKKVSRALDKLAILLKGKGITSTAAALSMVLSTQAIQAVPASVALNICTAAAVSAAVLPTASTTVGQGIIMTTLQKAILTAALLATTGTCIYEISKTTDVSVDDLAIAASIPAEKSQKFPFRPRLSGPGRALLSSNDIIAAYLKEKNYSDFTNLWWEARVGKGGLYDLLTETNYQVYNRETGQLLDAIICDTNQAVAYRISAMSFAVSRIVSSEKGSADIMQGLFAPFVSTLMDPTPRIRNYSSETLNNYSRHPGLKSELWRLEAISRSRPDDLKLRSIIEQINLATNSSARGF